MHISNEMAWRGGENQVRLLIEGLKLRGVESILSFPHKSEAQRILSLNVETVPLYSRAAYDLRSIFRLAKYCRIKNVDVLNAHSSGGMSIALAVKRLVPRLGLVVHKRTAFPIRAKWSTRRKYMSPLVDHYVGISKAIAKILLDYGLSEDKVATVFSAIEANQYSDKVSMENRLQWREKLKISGSDAVIVCASALTSEKGHDTLLSACEMLKNNGLRFRCLVAGSGPLESKLKEWVRCRNLNSDVSFLGFIGDIPNFLPVADILVLPSRAEGLGTILLEAAMAGCALVGSNVGGIPEIICDGETGFLFEAGDHVALSEKLGILINDPSIKAQLKENCREHVLKNFSLEKMVSGNLAVYQKIQALRSNSGI